MAEHQSLNIKQKIHDLQAEKKSRNFAAIFQEINQILILDINSNSINYRKLIHIVGEKLYKIEKRELIEILDTVKYNIIKLQDDTSIMRSILIICNYIDPEDVVEVLDKINIHRPDMNWALPMGLNYIDLSNLNEEKTLIVRRIINILLDSVDENVVDEVNFYRDKLEDWVRA